METLTTLEGRYLDHHRAMGSSPKTITHYVNTFLIFHRFLSARQIEPTSACLTTATCNAFAGWLRETPTRPRRGSTQRSVVTTHGHLKDLRAFVRWLYGEELIEQLPKVPIPKLPRTLFPILSDDELTMIFTCAQTDPISEIGKRNRALVMFMLDTGVRLAEVASLTPADLYLADNMAKIWGKGSRERFVFFSSTTAESLRLWLGVRGDDEGSLFWLKPSGVRMVLERIKKDTGIPVLHPHQLRHTALTMLVRNKVGIHSVRRIAGHSSLAVTEQYLSLSTEDLRQEHRSASPVDHILGETNAPPRARRRLSQRKAS
jgi:site-specific recombinase XerD